MTTTTAAPSPEKVLRTLFWQLLFRGRGPMDTGHKRRKQWSLGVTLAVYGLFGIVPAGAAFVMPPLGFASSLHAVTLLFASLTLASAAGTMLFVREEAEILLHRPVRAEQLLRAKVAVLVGYSLLLALALNAFGLIASFWNQGNAPWFALVHVVTTLLLMVFSAAAIVLAYNVCLRWFGRERFENLLTMVQMLLTMLMLGASQLLPRLGPELQGIDFAQTWAVWLPPVWFGALDVMLCGVAGSARLWPLALGAVATTALLSWLAFVRLGSAYGVGLMALNENTTADRDRPRTRRLRALVHAAPLRWWLRDPIERQMFLLTSAYLLRDRETKLKLYPAMAPMVVMPVVLSLSSRGGRSGGPGMAMATVGIAFAAIIPIQALMLLRGSEHWRAAALFRITPLPHWTPVFHGARKAMLAWLAFPSLLLTTIVLCTMHGSLHPFALAVPMLAILPVCAMLPGLIGAYLPLSMPSEDVRGNAGCLLFASAMIASLVLGGISAFLDHLGWFWPYAIVVLLLGAALQRMLGRMLRARRWVAAETD
jgi:hypothetical protein